MTTTSPLQVLILGYGASDQLDDGVGAALALEAAQLRLPGVTSMAAEKLTLCDAAAVAGQHVVVFVEASSGGAAPFEFFPIEADRMQAFFADRLTPQGVLALAQDIFHWQPDAYLLRIRGYEFNDFAETLTVRGRRNLERSLAFIKDFVEELPKMPPECHKTGPGGRSRLM